MSPLMDNSFQGSWQKMANAAMKREICIGKYDFFDRTIDITHEDGTVKRFAQWFFAPTFTDGYRLFILDDRGDCRLHTYLNGVSEGDYGKIVNIRIFPLSSIVPRPQYKITHAKRGPLA